MDKRYTEIKNKLKALFVRKTMVRKTRNATNDWLMALGISSVLAVVLCCVGAYVFFINLGEDELSVGTEELPKATFDRGRLLEVVSLFEERSASFDDLRSISPEIPKTSSEEIFQEEVFSEEQGSTTPEIE